MSSSKPVTSSKNRSWEDSDDEQGTSGIEVRQLSVAEAEYEAADAEDEESSDEDVVKNVGGHLPSRNRPSLLEGEEEYPSFSLAEESDTGPVTAFNLEEELDEGYVDKEGNFVGYYFENRIQNLEGVVSSSDEDEAQTEKRKPVRRNKVERDEWADSIEVVKPTYTVQPSSVSEREKPSEEPETVDDESPERTKEQYAKLARLVLSGESILQALKRLAGNKKDPTAKREFNEVTELADSLLNKGEYSIYEETRETCLMKAGLGEFSSSSSSKEKRKRKRDSEGLEESNSSLSDNQSRLHWELKWSHDPSKVYGPFSTEQLRNWQAWGYFNEAEAFVRDTETNNSFHVASSIDFSNFKE